MLPSWRQNHHCAIVSNRFKKISRHYSTGVTSLGGNPVDYARKNPLSKIIQNRETGNVSVTRYSGAPPSGMDNSFDNGPPYKLTLSVSVAIKARVGTSCKSQMDIYEHLEWSHRHDTFEKGRIEEVARGSSYTQEKLATNIEQKIRKNND